MHSKGKHTLQLQQEFALMSRKPGIASDWLTLHKDDVYPSDFITMNGIKMKPPKSYDRIYERTHKQEMEIIKETAIIKYLIFFNSLISELLITSFASFE